MSVFISYSHRNADWLHDIKHYFHAIEEHVWDDSKIKLGDPWQDDIEFAIENSKLAILVLTQDFIVSSFIESEELPRLLSKAHVERNYRILVIAAEPIDVGDVPNLTRYQWLFGPEPTLLDLREESEATYKNALVDISKSVKAILHEIVENESSDVPQSRVIHLLTGSKGGIGKTLMALSLSINYARQQLITLGVDLNSMNPDFIRMLYFENNTNSVREGWKILIPDKYLTLISPKNPYTLPEGTYGFWKRVLDAKNYQEQAPFIIVDTNLHIANLYDGPTSEQSIINSILKQCQLYIWILWTHAAVQESHIIGDSIRHFRKRYGNNIEFVHVLNPSALLPAYIDLNKEIDQLIELRNEEKSAENLLSSKNISEELKIHLENVRSELKKKSGELLEEMKELDPTEITGLAKLHNSGAVEPISDEEVIQFLKNSAREFEEDRFQTLADAIIRKHGGCPVNIVPISTHNPSLIGYTEEIMIKRDFDYIQGKISKIVSQIKTVVQWAKPIG